LGSGRPCAQCAAIPTGHVFDCGAVFRGTGVSGVVVPAGVGGG
jgi:hypothetical protein